ncbi:MAG: hypothetical protein DYG89_29220 [Caldilinea sp. CFX5]|nr:hypothetical protein [Caldilinea sp. CFX5]
MIDLPMNAHLDFVTLNEYLDQTLSAAQRAVVDEHLAACPHCRRQVAEWQTLFTSLDELPEAPLRRDLSADVLAAIATRPRPSAAPTVAAPLPWRLLLLQTVVAGVVLLLLQPWATRLLPENAFTGLGQPFLAWWRAIEISLATASATIAGAIWAWLKSGYTFLPPDLPDTQHWLNLAPPGWGLLLLAAGLCWLAGVYWGLTDYQLQNGEEQ